MSLFIKPNRVKFKSGDKFVGANAVAEKSTAELVKDVKMNSDKIVTDANKAIQDANTALAGVKSERDAFVKSITDALETGTDTTLTLAGVPADAKATGDKLSELKDDIGDTKAAYLATNCAEMVSLLGLTEKSQGGRTFVPSHNGTRITMSDSTGLVSIYELYNGSIEESLFRAGAKYFVKYTAPAGTYLQFVRDGTTEILNTASFSGEREITIPAETENLLIRLYCTKTAESGVHEISIINARSEDYLETARFAERPTIADISNLAGLMRENLFGAVDTIAGKYVNANNGVLNNLASFSATDYFNVQPGATYRLTYRTSGSQIAFYDAYKAYVMGFETTGNTFTVPEDSRILFARWCADTASLDKWGLYVEPITAQKIKYITKAEGILAGVIDAYAKGIGKIIVQPGTYDIIAEYEAYYGNGYFANYASNYNGLVNGHFDCGVWLENVDIVFSAGVFVNANYTGDNSFVKEWFSAFAIGQNVTIDGLVLDASELRYGLHPDFHVNPTETLTIRNCDLHHYKASSTGPNNNQAIGAGVGVYATWNIENCVLRADTSNPVLRIHNNASSQAKSNIVIKDCYIVGDGYILLNSYSTSTKKTLALVSGCSWKNPAVVGKETSDSVDNVVMYAWNNETRQ